MKTIVRNILAIIIGWLIGSFVNMGLIETGHVLIPIEGLNPNDMKALAEVKPKLSPK